MKKIFYEKKGRKYVPICEYDQKFYDSYPKGTHVVICNPGVIITRYNIEPEYAAMIAAGVVAEDAIAQEICKISELYTNEKLNDEQLKAWNNLIECLGEKGRLLNRRSAADIARAGVSKMMDSAMKLLEDPAVKESWDNFQRTCQESKIVNKLKGLE